MSDKFAEDLMIRLAEYSKGPSTSTPQDKVTAQLAPLHTRLKKLLDTLPLSEQNKGLSLLDLQTRLRGRKKKRFGACWRAGCSFAPSRMASPSCLVRRGHLFRITMVPKKTKLTTNYL